LEIYSYSIFLDIKLWTLNENINPTLLRENEALARDFTKNDI